MRLTLIRLRHMPTVWEIFLFVAGAIAAFAGLWLLGRGAVERSRPVEQGPARVLAGALDIFAVGLAVGSAALVAMIQSWVSWPLAAFGATALYMIAASFQLAVAQGRQTR